ncbi:DHA2 family efflux MFS transporter permease subunit [Azospirillum doebereinerae]|uniref:DHA2 family efflux MFS transporter permease subunit n=1 Tax=Azospirillum doebereinerae TaxID=92933 RepID=UPI001EE50F8D|nr:DHA2 family efflux MFS transporter permease subunit [Azospirillum doebereinerae]MCG5241976.1 DHA2 family efflux MFS transporter permease subunit [Azospirillum doebereinerae]
MPPSFSRIVPLIIACALFMENLDATVISTALPSIARSMGEDPLRLSLAMTSYMLALAVFLPVSGWAADRFGARTVFASAIGVFTVGSVLCGLSNGLPELVGARIVQGIGGSMMVPVGRLILLRTVPKDQLVQAMARMTLPALIGPALGPLVGGAITTYASWRWIFLINVPIGLIGIALVLKLIPNLREEQRDPFDGTGFMLSAVALAAFMFGFENAGRDLMPPLAVAGLLGVALGATWLYLRHIRGMTRPVLDPSLFRLPTYRASVLGGTLFRIGIGAVPFLMPVMLQIGFGLTAFESGALTFAGAAGALTMKALAGPILRRAGFRRVLAINALVSGAVLAGYGAFRPDTPHALILGALLLGGFFRSLQFTGLNSLAYAEVPQPATSRANTLANVMQQLSLSLGVAVGATALHLTTQWTGGALTATDFVPAFLTVGLMACASSLFFLGLPADAGSEISGHRRGAAAVEAVAARDAAHKVASLSDAAD